MFTEIRTLLADHHHELRMTGLGLTAIGRESPGIRLSVSRRARFHARMNGNLPLPTTKFRRKPQCIQRVISKCGGDRRGVSKYGFRGPSGAIRAPGRGGPIRRPIRPPGRARPASRSWRRWRRGRRAQPPQVPPPTAYKAAQRRMSAGRSGSGERRGWGDGRRGRAIPPPGRTRRRRSR